MPNLASIERLAREEGFEQGLEQGRREGLLEGIALVLDARFGKRGRRLLPRIRALENVAAMRALARLLKTATLDEVRMHLTQGAGGDWYWPTPQKVVGKMLELAKVTRDDVVYDLGCGDGRFVVTAAKKYGVRAVGVDFDPVRVREARARVKAAGVEGLVSIRRKDIFKTDLSGASVVTLYLNDEANLALMPILKKSLKPGSRVVSQTWDMGAWKPDRMIVVDGIDEKENSRHKYVLYLWIIGEAD